MVRHAVFWIVCDQARHQRRDIGITGHDRPVAGLADSERLVAVNERNIVSLPDPAMTGDAVLIKDRSNIAAEFDAIPCGKLETNVMPCLYTASHRHRRKSGNPDTPNDDHVAPRAHFGTVPLPCAPLTLAVFKRPNIIDHSYVPLPLSLRTCKHAVIAADSIQPSILPLTESVRYRAHRCRPALFVRLNVSTYGPQ